MKELILDVSKNAEGGTLAILSTLDKKGDRYDGFRIAGPKAWGGSNNIASLKLTTDDLIDFIKGYTPEIIKELIPEQEPCDICKPYDDKSILANFCYNCGRKINK
jgi:hypothetical protein